MDAQLADIELHLGLANDVIHDAKDLLTLNSDDFTDPTVKASMANNLEALKKYGKAIMKDAENALRLLNIHTTKPKPHLYTEGPYDPDYWD